MRIWLHREGNTNVQESVQFFTADGPSAGRPYTLDAPWPGGVVGFEMRPAKAGVDYVATSGNAVFLVGETSTSIDIPLIDNGLLDGFKDFFVIHNGSAQPWQLVRIQDNELHSAVDPLFVLDRRFSYDLIQDPIVMPDGRLLLSDLTMLQTNGSVDIGFATNVLTTFHGARLYALRALSDGQILAEAEGPSDTPMRLVRLFPTGVLDTSFQPPRFWRLIAVQPDGGILAGSDFPNGTIRRLNVNGTPGATPAYPLSNFGSVAAELPDGSVLIFRYGPDRLARLKADGSPDASFAPITFGRDTGFGQVAVQPNGKIVVNIAATFGFKRFHSDGTPDDGFAPHPSHVLDFLLTRDGKFIVNDGTDFLRLNDDGSLNVKFQLPDIPDWPGPRALGGAKHELPDGDLLIAPSWPLDFQDSIVRLKPNGSIDRSGTSAIWNSFICGSGDLRMKVGNGRVFVSIHSIGSVDGIQSYGLWRLLPNPPERDFRVMRPIETSRADRAVRIEIVRTGPTTNAASVSFRTRDATARAGVDYQAQQGRLEFAPLDVKKEVVVPLLSNGNALELVSFNVELVDPSAGYSVIPVTPVSLSPELRIGIEAPPKPEGAIALRLDGTIPGYRYSVWASTDFANPDLAIETVAVSPTTRFTVSTPRRPIRFFWAFRQ